MRKNKEVITYIDEIDEEFPNIVESVIKSLLSSQIDYCYSRESAEKIKAIVRDKNIPCCFLEVLDEDGNFDYTQFIPVQYYQKISGINQMVDEPPIYSVYAIPKEYQCRANIGGRNKILKDYGETFHNKGMLK